MRKWVILAALAAACAGSENLTPVGGQTPPAPRSQTVAWYQAECVREYPLSALEASLRARDPSLQEIAEQCAWVAVNQRGIAAARARFYGGRAYGQIGNDNPNNRTALTEARRNLRAAISAAPDFRRDFARELREARYAYVRASIDLGDEGALADASELLRNEDATEVAYERALIAEVRGDKEEAFNALRTTYTSSDEILLEDPACRDPRFADASRAACASVRFTRQQVDRGRARLFELGYELGNARLERRDAEAAAPYFQAAKNVIRVACQSGSCGGLGGIATDNIQQDAYFKFGLAQLIAAGVPQDTNVPIETAGSLDCLNGERTPGDRRISEALSGFREMSQRWPNSDSAKWGVGCAILAGLADSGRQADDLRAAIASLELANPTTTATLLSLARAKALRGDLDTPVAFDRALGTLPNTASARIVRASILVEKARSQYVNRGIGRQPLARTGTTLYSRAIEDIQAASEQLLGVGANTLDQALNANTGDPNNIEARLIRGHIALRRGDYAQAGPLFVNIINRPRPTPGLAEAQYLYSRCVTLARQTRWDPVVQGRPLPEQNCGRPRGAPADENAAVSYARQAFVIDSNPVYRHQACVAYTVFEHRGGEQYCSTDSGRDRDYYAEALLFEGMYWLRMRNFSRAHQAFQTGIEDLRRTCETDGRADVDFETPLLYQETHPQPPLQCLLEYGERYVLSSSGIEDSKFSRDDVKRFYSRFGFRT